MDQLEEKKRVTVIDVAREAGVSPASVSRVLNNVHPISEELRRSVMEAAERLGYEKRGSGFGNSSPICVLVPDTHNPYFHEISAGIEEQAAEYDLFVTQTVLPRFSPLAEQAFRWLSRANLEGVILTSSDRTIDDEMLRTLRQDYDVPVVVLNRQAAIPGIPTIRIDFADGTYRATRHLLRLNHKRIAFFDGLEGSESGRMKSLGFDRALREAGTGIPEKLRVRSEPTVEAGYQIMTRFLELPEHERPTAVLCLNDMNALGVLHAARAKRISIPEQLSVIGFDDISMAAHANPPLTTISSPKREMGKLAVRLLYQIRTQGDAPIDHYTMMESPLIVRESTSFCPEV